MAAHFQAGGERKAAEDFELCSLMKCVECEKNETIDKNFVFLNVAVKLH